MDADMKSKLDGLRSIGIEPYAYGYKRTHSSKEVHDGYDGLEGKEVSVAGRIKAVRGHGKISFIDVYDREGKIQVYYALDQVGEDNYKLREYLDVGDIIGVKGEVFKTKKGEVSVKAKELTVLSKALRHLPEKWHGLKDTEARYRKRHLDLIMNKEAYDVFVKRARIISSIREFLDSRGYIEVETPVLQPIYGGAAARPFTTEHHALERTLFLRIADELYLKRLIVGGMEKVYEISKNFRNEDIDSTHNPEFTAIEFYEAYADYNQMMDLTEKLVVSVLKKVNNGELKVAVGEKEVDFTPPWKRVSIVDEIKKESGVDVMAFKTDEEAIEKAKSLGVVLENVTTKTQVIEAMFDHFVEPKLWDPVFIIDYPAEMCPLTKEKRGEPRLSERFELFVAGRELANAYSELNDPVIQREKFVEQVKERQKGDDEAQPMDEPFLEAMEHGFPPTGGVGIGIDRLVMLLTNNVSIKEVILFPSMKTIEGEKEAEETE